MSSVLLELQSRLASPAVPWQIIFIGVTLLVTSWEHYISSRQKPFLNPVLHPTMPASLLRALGPSEEHAKAHRSSQRYMTDKINFSSICRTISLFETFLLLTGFINHMLGFPFPDGWTGLRGLWNVAADLTGAVGKSGVMWHSMSFLLVTTVLGTFTEMPKDYWSHFVLEETHGFNKMTHATFFKDAALNTLISLLTQIPLMGGLLWIIDWVGPHGALRITGWAMVLIFAFIIAMQFIHPYVILPLQNTLTPLKEDAPVTPLIKQLAERTGFPLGNVYVIDGSKRSSHSNAFFFGLPIPGFPKTICIFDTLLENSTPAEVVSVLAHELGHWKANHVVYLLSCAMLQVGFSILCFTIFLGNQPLLTAFGFPPSSYEGSSPPAIITLTLASYLFAPTDAILKVATNTLTRALEYDADAFAWKLGKTYAEHLKDALTKLHVKNFALYGVDKLYSIARNNHPTLQERLDALDHLIAVEGKKSD